MAKRGRGVQMLRMFTILGALKQGRGLTAEEITGEVCGRLGLGAEQNFDKRTIYRDLRLLDGTFGWVRREGNEYFIADAVRDGLKIGLTPEEMLSVSLARQLLSAFDGTPVSDGLESLLMKFKPFLGTKEREFLEGLGECLIFKGRARGNQPDPQVVKRLFVAIQERRTVLLTHQPLSWDHPYEGTFDPVGLVFFGDTLYLIANSHRRKKKKREQSIVLLKAARISEVKLLEKKFTLPRGFDFEKRLAGVIGVFTGGSAQEYRIRVSNFIARLIQEAPWHESQALKKDGPDHHVMTLKLDNTVELTPRILALGPAAEVLSPPDYREIIAAQVAEMVARYRQQ